MNSTETGSKVPGIKSRFCRGLYPKLSSEGASEDQLPLPQKTARREHWKAPRSWDAQQRGVPGNVSFQVAPGLRNVTCAPLESLQIMANKQKVLLVQVGRGKLRENKWKFLTSSRPCLIVFGGGAVCHTERAWEQCMKKALVHNGFNTFFYRAGYGQDSHSMS